MSNYSREKGCHSNFLVVVFLQKKARCGDPLVVEKYSSATFPRLHSKSTSRKTMTGAGGYGLEMEGLRAGKIVRYKHVTHSDRWHEGEKIRNTDFCRIIGDTM